MPGGRPPINLEGRREWITERVAAGITQDEIRRELEEHHGLKVGRSKLMQQLAKWNITARRPAYKDSDALRERVAHCFHVLRLTDDKTQDMLEKEGFNIGAKRIARLRKEMGLLKRIPAEERDDAEAVIAKLLQQELKEGNNIRELGRKQLYKHIRSKYNVIGRDRIYKVANLFDPQGPSRRRVENGRATATLRRTGPQPTDSTTTEDNAPADLDNFGDVDSIDPDSIDPLIMAVSDAQMAASLNTPADITECNSSDHFRPSAHIQ